MTVQYLRKIGLVVTQGGSGLDLSQMRIRFRTFQFDYQTPNYTEIRVYNLSDATAGQINARGQNEFTNVILQAGYESGAYGVIFQGTIKMVRRGREDETNTYLDILAADGDIPYNFDVVNRTIAAGATAKDKIDALAQNMKVPVGYVPDLPQGALSRGKVMYGLSRDYMRDVSRSVGASWSIENGKLVMIPITGYRAGDAVVVNAQTGMVGLPEQTEGGVKVKILLNPNVRIGSLLQIDNRSVQRAFVGPNYLFAQGRLEDIPGLLPKVTSDGFYKCFVVEHSGDTRGGASSPWYSHITCLAVDRSAAPSTAVSPSGGAVNPPGTS